MLPLPGAPSSSWAMYRARLAAAFDGMKPRVYVAFWLFGLINNVLYVIILSAALDLVGPNVPKGVVLLADVIPSFLIKLCAPYFIHTIPYSIRIILFAVLSTIGMLLIALAPAYTDGGTISTKMAGVVLASLSSGGGEQSFLSFTHFYGPLSLAAWGSGTGAAGLIGAGAYAIATTALKMNVKTTLLASSLLPVIMLFGFFLVLPRGMMRKSLRTRGQNESSQSGPPENYNLPRDVINPENEQGEPTVVDREEEEGLLAGRRLTTSCPEGEKNWWKNFEGNLRRSRGLFFPFMLPLLLVYLAEYTINQGVAPTLLFPLKETPFQHFRAFYPTYNAIYQTGVFLSRSSSPFFRVHNLYIPSLLQVVNVLLLAFQAVFNFIPNVYIVFILIFWEGLLGGLVYVNTFAEILDTVPREDREFSLGATSVSDSGGICIAGFICMALEVALCNYQVRHGRDYCKKI